MMFYKTHFLSEIEYSTRKFLTKNEKNDKVRNLFLVIFHKINSNLSINTLYFKCINGNFYL